VSRLLLELETDPAIIWRQSGVIHVVLGVLKNNSKVFIQLADGAASLHRSAPCDATYKSGATMQNSTALLALTALDCRDAWHKLAALADRADADSLRRATTCACRSYARGDHGWFASTLECEGAARWACWHGSRKNVAARLVGVIDAIRRARFRDSWEREYS
jgi:hypothetical protein